MPVIVIDGPEKAGKTTLIRSLSSEFERMGVFCSRVHWGHIIPDDRAYTNKLIADCTNMNKISIWDRGWPSEYVYGKLTGRDHRMTHDPWIGEWLHGRAVQVSGLRVIFTGPHHSELSNLRDSSDMFVPPKLEQKLYIEYGKRFGWTIIQNNHTDESLRESVSKIIVSFFSRQFNSKEWLPPRWAGPPESKIVVIGETLSKKVIPGGWLPFTSPLTTRLGREFGDDALKVSWTNMDSCSPSQLRAKETVITCGKVVNDWYAHNREKGVKPQKIINIPHPSYLFRFNNERVRQQLMSVRQVLSALKPL